ncbi:mll2313 protein [Gracilibacillus boraciitolerans JCM 21714]|uniref:Mll2313 protein n=1 Tax=Gracilibacillus boraciitolerans JCM 21714 TaxID=1298598 RepID=W4VG29_9BACI|nr:mll2313 protein [Gracilibacillus boraciitolerans JCM 21714]
MKKALIFQGGWQGHEPEKVAGILAGILEEEDFNVKITNTLTTLQEDDLTQYDLIVPNWTQGTIEKDQLQPLIDAVAQGTGLAGLHGGEWEIPSVWK